MREAAERALISRCGSQLEEQTQMLGNAPSSFYQYKYPRHYSEERGVRGAKVFIFKAYLKHQMRVDPGVEVQVQVTRRTMMD